MKRRHLLLIFLVVTGAAPPAAALWTETRVTPKSEDSTRRLTARSELRNGLRQFEVVVEQRGGRKISPFADATLSLTSEDRTVAEGP